MEKDDKIFVGEVVSDVREENVFNIINRFKWVIIGVVALVIGGVAGVEIFNANTLKAQIQRTDAVTAQLEGAQEVNIAELENGPALAQMLLAKQALEAGDLDKAIDIYTQVAGNGENSKIDRALAALNKFSIDDSLEPGTLDDAGAPFEAEAQLILAQKLLASGDIDAGLKVAQELHQNPRGDQLRSLVEMLIIQNGGELSETAPDEVDENSQQGGTVDAS